MSEINCNACETLKVTSPNFVQNGITNTECTSLAADTGLNPSLNPKHNDAEDLHVMNDCLIGRQAGDLEKYDVCDWQDFMERFIPNLYETLKGIICAIGGIWTYIHILLSRMSSLEGRVTALETTVGNHTTQINNLNNKYNSLKNIVDELIEAIGGSSNTIPVFRKYSYTVPVIPVTEMESIIGVWAQPKVVPGGNPYDGMGKDFMQTVAVQTYVHQGDNLIVNFDALELAPNKVGAHNGGPYPLPIEFLVVGTKTIET